MGRLDGKLAITTRAASGIVQLSDKYFRERENGCRGDRGNSEHASETYF